MKKSTSEQVISFIEEKIRSGEWKSGMKISTEAQLQKEIGVSKTSVREAVERLVAMNVLTKRQGDGTYVNDFDAGIIMDQMIPYLLLAPQDVLKILEFREVLEPSQVIMFVERYNSEAVEKLEQLLDVMEMHQNDDEAFHNADMEFHRIISEGTGNPIMTKVSELLHESNKRYHFVASQTIGLRSGLEEHRWILKAIKDKDKELASLLLKRHIQRSKKDMMAYFSEQCQEEK